MQRAYNMETREVKCTACGAPVLIDGSSRSVVCRYCGAAIVVADFEELKVTKAVAATQVEREQLNQLMFDRKRERIKQLEVDLHAAEISVEQNKRRALVASLCGSGAFLLCFLASWHFLWIALIGWYLGMLYSSKRTGQNIKILAIRRQLDDLIK